MTRNQDELVFVPLGGLGEIGMNAALYGFGPPRRRKWILVDCGLAFAGPDLPGIDLIMPDLTFIEGMRQDLLALIVTHAHEDHVGADRATVAASALPGLRHAVRGRSAGDAPPRRRRRAGCGHPHLCAGRSIAARPVRCRARSHGAFDSRKRRARHPHATPARRCIPATGRSTRTPVAGWATDEARLRAIGDEGVLALICEFHQHPARGESPSETDVGAELGKIIAERRAAWSSPPSRPTSRACAPSLLPPLQTAAPSSSSGARWSAFRRSRARTAISTACPIFCPPDSFANLPREKMVLLATGSQGEPRAAMARIADEEHPDVKLAKGDTVIFSSRTIPGNERAIGGIINKLCGRAFEC